MSAIIQAIPTYRVSSRSLYNNNLRAPEGLARTGATAASISVKSLVR